MNDQPFLFKQFSIHQDQCAMKVGTDGVLLGAWADGTHACQALDIGTGTGLVALMLAQRFPTLKIDAIELDGDASEQAFANVSNSKFHRQIAVYHADFMTFEPSKKYDLIVSNPPFFEDNKKMELNNRKIARQQQNMSIEQLIFRAKGMLSTQGKISLILPYQQLDSVREIAQQQSLYFHQQTNVKGNERTTYKRVLITLGLHQVAFEEDELIIEKERHQYTEDYVKLTKDFYLKM